MFDQARSLELAIVNSESYSSPPLSVNAAVPPTATEHQEQTDPGTLAAVGSPGVGSNASSCFFCGNSNHPRSKCPARDAICSNCQKRGHFAKVCRRRKISKNKVSAAAWSPTLATVGGAPESLLKSSGTVNIEGLEVKALFDSGSTESFIHPRLVERVALTVHPSSGTVSMAQYLVRSVSPVPVWLICSTKDVNIQVTSCPSCQDFVLTSSLVLISNLSIRASLSIMEDLNPHWPSVALVN